MATKIKALRLRVAVALDRLGNAALGFGHSEQTISARCYEGKLLGLKRWYRFSLLVDWLFAGRFFPSLFGAEPNQTDHCRGAFNNETARTWLPDGTGEADTSIIKIINTILDRQGRDKFGRSMAITRARAFEDNRKNIS